MSVKELLVPSVALGLEVLVGDEAQGRRVDAVAQPALVGGPSSKTWPRWLSPWFERTSVRIMPWLASRFSTTLVGSRGMVKLGHPHPLSNFLVEANSGSPETMST